MQRTDDQDGWEIKPLPIIGQYNVQRFTQFSPEDAANFYVVNGKDTKKPYVMYPTFGRKHIEYGGQNRLQFGGESRLLFRTKNYWYNVVGNSIFRIDSNFNTVNITLSVTLQSITGNIFATQLVVNTETFVCFVDGQKVYIYREVADIFDIVTDPNAPGNYMQDGVLTKPGYIAAFGNRITVSVLGSSQFFLSAINLNGGSYTKNNCFTVNGAAVFAQENGVIGQMGVLNNTLYIYCDFTTGIWANIPAIFSGTGSGGTGVYFPWKKNTTYDWNMGIADPLSLAINFGRMTFLAQNRDGLLQVVSGTGGEPKPTDNQAIDVLFQDYANDPATSSPFLEGNANGFLMQYENAVMYRLSAGQYTGTQILDDTQYANSLEYHYGSDTWHRCIEQNGERYRVQKHVFYNNRHLVSIQGEGTIYELSGRFYSNETRNPLQPDDQAEDAYINNPMRYERITPIIFQDDYSEFETDYAQIDFVFGDGENYLSKPPLIKEDTIDIGGHGAGAITVSVPTLTSAGYVTVSLISSSNFVTVTNVTPGTNSFTVTFSGDPGASAVIFYQAYTYQPELFKPTIELYYSDDGGISYETADELDFGAQGLYQWRMRWYQLGCSRNRVYKLVCVSFVPIVVLGATMKIRRVSGGAD